MLFRSNIVESDGNPSLLADLRDQTPGSGIDAQRNLQLNTAHRLSRRQRGRKVDVGAGETEDSQAEQADHQDAQDPDDDRHVRRLGPGNLLRAAVA